VAAIQETRQTNGFIVKAATLHKQSPVPKK
jgi:hypothetical protein